MAGSSTESAQRLANAANLQIAAMSNASQIGIAQRANELNYRMFNEQNEWNREQWRLENEYNSPARQVERYIEAGINPIFGISGGDPGNSQHLESASSPSAEVPSLSVPQVQPEYDPNRVGNIIAAAQNVVNSMQGFTRLYLEGEDVDTRRSAVDVQRKLADAEVRYKRAQTAGQEIYNNLNTDTYGIQIQTKLSQLHDINSRISETNKRSELYDEEILNARETRSQIVAMTNYVGEQSKSLIDERLRGWYALFQRNRELAIQQQNADSQSASVALQSDTLELDKKKFSHEKIMSEKDFSLRTNQQILDFIENSRGKWEKFLGITFGEHGDINIAGDILRELLELRNAGEVLRLRAVNEPSDSNVSDYSEYLRFIKNIPKAPTLPVIRQGNAPVIGVENPSQNW